MEYQFVKAASFLDSYVVSLLFYAPVASELHATVSLIPRVTGWWQKDAVHNMFPSTLRSKTVEHSHLMRLKHRNSGPLDVDMNLECSYLVRCFQVRWRKLSRCVGERLR